MPPPHKRKDLRDAGYVRRVATAADVLANVLLFGKFETISSRLGKRKLSRGGVLEWRDWWGVAKPLDAVLELIDPGHSLEAIDFERGDTPRPPSTSTRR